MDAAADIAQVLDKLEENNYFKKSINIKYVPIRSEGNREMGFNNDFWVDKVILKEYFNVPINQIEKSEFVFQNGYLIENLLNHGTPMEINALEHSRTCVGYNKKYLLFADNWGNNYEQYDDSDMKDIFSAGFSVVDKWGVYSNMRDIVYYL